MSVELRVAEAPTRVVGRGLAVVDPKVVEEQGWKAGDIIEIKGKQTAYAKLWPGQVAEYDNGLIRIDGYVRNNAGVGLDDRVDIRRIEVRDADKIVLYPTEPLRIIGGERYLAGVFEGQVVSKGTVFGLNIMGRRVNLIVSQITPSSDAVLITSNTRVELTDKPPVEVTSNIPKITYEDIGGLDKEISRVREMIELPLKHPELFERLGVEAPKGVLLHGPPGTGKTLLAKAVANESDANFYTIGGPEIMSKYYGESEERLREIFSEAQKNAPSIIFIDELDSIAPKREEVTGEVEKRVVSQLLNIMDGLESRGKVVVIGATNRPNSLDPALRRPGRFDREIEIGLPDRNGRHEVLQIHARGMPLTDDVDLEDFADRTHGFTGADLEALGKEAAMGALRRILPEIDLEATSIPVEILEKINVTSNDFEEALNEVHPSGMREIFVESPNVHWEQVGGLQEAKNELREAVEWPLKYHELYQYAGAEPPKGILLYGPPGTGKTLLAKAVATEGGVNFISIKGPELLSKWVGESERGVREVFRKARLAAPSIIFFDELDSITPTRGSGLGDSGVTERIISQILTELDGLEELRNVVVLGATNRPDMVDSALIRPGRFDRLIHIPEPDLDARKEIWKIHLSGKPLDEDVDIDSLAKDTEKYTGAEIAEAASTASINAIKRHLQKFETPEEANKYKEEIKILPEDIKEALEKVKPMSERESSLYRKSFENFLAE
jgi:transitional endoplasmic reticulum ATPase